MADDNIDVQDKVYPRDLERVDYKFDCDCRKPKPGIILTVAKDFNIDLTQSWMIGDSESDVMIGKNTGCSTALIGLTGKDGGKYDRITFS